MAKHFNKKVYRIICVGVVLFIVFIWVFMIDRTASKDRVCFENKCFDVEIADNDESRQLWLMYRDSLKDGDGMLFVFPQESIYSFWMKNTLIPLDMIRIKKVENSNEEYKVVDIKTAMPCTSEECPSFVPSGIAQYVLEINAWLAQKYDIKVWDKLYLDLSDN